MLVLLTTPGTECSKCGDAAPRKEWETIFFKTDACVEPVLNFKEVEGNLQNQASYKII